MTWSDSDLDPERLPRVMLNEEGNASPCADPDLAARLGCWRDQHRRELLECWEQAVERYFAFYPDALPS